MAQLCNHGCLRVYNNKDNLLILFIILLSLIILMSLGVGYEDTFITNIKQQGCLEYHLATQCRICGWQFYITFFMTWHKPHPTIQGFTKPLLLWESECHEYRGPYRCSTLSTIKPQVASGHNKKTLLLVLVLLLVVSLIIIMTWE